MEFNSSLHSDPSKRHSNKNYPKQNTKKKYQERERGKKRGEEGGEGRKGEREKAHAHKSIYELRLDYIKFLSPQRERKKKTEKFVKDIMVRSFLNLI